MKCFEVFVKFYARLVPGASTTVQHRKRGLKFVRNCSEKRPDTVPLRDSESESASGYLRYKWQVVLVPFEPAGD